MFMMVTSKVELRISCSNLPNLDTFSKTDCQVYVFQVPPRTVVSSKAELKVLNQCKLLGTTETIKNSLNPVFSTPVVVDYFFEQEQRLKILLLDIDGKSKRLEDHDFIASAEITLAQIVTAKNQKVTIPIQIKGHNSAINIACEEVQGSEHEIKFSLTCSVPKKNLFAKPDPFIKAFREREDGSIVAVWTSSVSKNSTDFVLNEKIPLKTLSNSDMFRVVTYKIFDWESNGDHIYIGEFSASPDEMMKNGVFNIAKYTYDGNPETTKRGAKKSDIGKASFSNAVMVENFTFLEYIKAGTQLNFTVAIDFTASNGEPSQPNSLHFMGSMNEYQHTITAVGNIIQHYDTDKLFPAYGFGAKLPNGQVSHAWAINGNPENPACPGVQGVLDAYKLALSQITLYGPTNFAPIISQVCNAIDAEVKAKQSGHTRAPWAYHTLLIITDGEITDFDATCRAIVRASSLPMSIIIVGVGNGSDFQNMKTLDGDNAALQDERGNRVSRDIVQFVPMRELKTNRQNAWGYEQELASLVLAELPNQLCQWFRLRNIKPGQ